MPKLHPQHCNRPPAASSPSSVPHLRDHSDLPQPPSPLHCFVSASTVHRNILGMHLPHRPGKQIKQGRRQAIFRSSLSFLSSKYNTSVSSPTLYQATQCSHSYFYASISRGLSRFWWHTLLSYLLWSLSATPTPSSPSPPLSVRSQYQVTHSIQNPVAVFEKSQKNSYYLTHGHHLLLKTREGNKNQWILTKQI